MTEADYQTLQALAKCRFFPGSFEKRFVSNLASFAPHRELSERQRETLGNIAWSYREQLAGHGIIVTTKPARVLAAEQAEQAREREKLKSWNEGRPL